MLLCAMASAILAMPLAQLGSKGLYLSGAVVALTVAVYLLRDLLAPVRSEVAARLRSSRRSVVPPSRVRSAMALFLALAVAVGLAFELGHLSSKYLFALIGLVLFVVSFWLLWPTMRLLFITPPDVEVATGSLRRSETIRVQWETLGLGRGRTDVVMPGRLRNLITAVAFTCIAGVGAFGAAKLGSKALLALVGLVVVVSCLVKAKDKTLISLFATVCSLAFLVHKTFGPRDLTVAGGAPSIYVSSFDALILLLYVLWIREGTFGSDLRRVFRSRTMWVPPIGALLMLPSFLAQGASGWLGLAELARMGWMYLLFVYVAARVRTREMVWAILAALGAFAVLEIVVVLLQWKTKGVLGLSFLGVPTQLTKRVTSSSQVGRPFGTIIHPDFMGATMGAIALVFLAVALHRRRGLLKVSGVVLSVGCVVCLYLAHTRTSLAAWVLVFLVTIAVCIFRRRLMWKTVGKIALTVGITGAVFFPQLYTHYKENFGTGHFSEEITSRYQLNDVAWAMFEQNPVIGVGLNSFQDAMGPYEEAGVIFIQNPVQNLYLLYVSETGVIGTVGFVLVGVTMFVAAVKLGRSKDRLMGGLGLGISAAMAFFAIEELMDFALRQDVPLALYWLLGGLVIACLGMSESLESSPSPSMSPKALEVL